MKIRQETESDQPAVFELIEKAFASAEFSDHQEQYLVERLRKSDAFVPELSLVATDNDKIVGYILLTKLKIKNEQDEFSSLAMAPVAVHPDYQKKGLGGQLIEEAHHIAKELGFNSVVLLGHATYYPRFGYKKASQFGIKLPFDVPDEYAMTIELNPNALEHVSGMVVYPKEFML